MKDCQKAFACSQKKCRHLTSHPPTLSTSPVHLPRHLAHSNLLVAGKGGTTTKGTAFQCSQRPDSVNTELFTLHSTCAPHVQRAHFGSNGLSQRCQCVLNLLKSWPGNWAKMSTAPPPPPPCQWPEPGSSFLCGGPVANGATFITSKVRTQAKRRSTHARPGVHMQQWSAILPLSWRIM